MGKAARKKSAARAAVIVRPTLVLVKPPEKTAAELERELAIAMRQEAAEILENDRHMRLNNLPIGHPDNEHKLGLTFDPIDKWLKDFYETGEYEVQAVGGLAIFQPRPDDLEWYPVVDSFMAVCDTYELIAAAAGVPDQTEPIRLLAKKIHYDMPVNSSEITAARKTIEWMKEMTRPMTPLQFSHYTTAIQVRATIAENEKPRKKRA